MERRNAGSCKNVIAIAAGIITVVAIVLAFASAYLGLAWRWLRPAAELLLLGELVGLIVLERHQLFEPVHSTVGEIKVDTEQLRSMVAELTYQFGAAGQTTVLPTSHELLRTITRIVRESFARDQQTPQILRMARFAGEPQAIVSDTEYDAEFRSLNDALMQGMHSAGSGADAKARWWSIRTLGAVWDLEQFEFILERLVGPWFEKKPLNLELKFMVQPRIHHSHLSPLIADRDSILTFDDENAMFRWGILFQGRQYATLFTRWFDEIWTSVSDAYLVYTRNGLNQKALERIRAELGGENASRDRASA